jgi:hypothetical protein
VGNRGDSSSPLHYSRLVELFARRAGLTRNASPHDAISNVVSQLRRRFRPTGGLDERMRFYLSHRQIISARIVEDFGADAALDPIGSRYTHGFNVRLTKKVCGTRLRFTLAHEICHTFFYEYVPEIKFIPHGVDETEERLCNFGAAELLMPATALRRVATGRPICMQSLCELASLFSVSVTAMFLRLRSLRLWDCVFSEWQRMINGTFVMAGFYGGKRVPWEWEDATILEHAWQSHRPTQGSTMVGYKCEQGLQYYSPARFQAQRLGNRVVALWGNKLTDPAPSATLFEPLPSA